jgi:heptosyltransferase-2
MAVSEPLVDGLSFLKYASIKTSHSLGSLGKSGDFSPDEVRTVLAFTLSGIGNTIMYTPTLMNLRKALPDARIICVVGPRGSGDVVEGSPYVDEVVVQPVFRRVSGVRASMRYTRKLKGLNPQLTLNNFLSTGPDNAMLAYRSGARWRVAHAYGPEDRHWKRYYVGYENFYTHTVPVVEDRHEVDMNLDLLRALDLKVKKAEPFFWTGPEEEDFAQGFIRRQGLENRLLVGFHPGTHSDMTYKRWDPARFAAVIKRTTRELDAVPLLFGSEDERELAAKILKKAGVQDAAGKGGKGKGGKGGKDGPRGKGDALNLCGKMPLKKAAAVIGKCRAFVSNDSGLMHVAAAKGVPVVGIFGPTDHRRTSPYGKGHVVLRSGEGCSPCYMRAGTLIDCQHRRCLEKISVEKVWGALERQVYRE